MSAPGQADAPVRPGDVLAGKYRVERVLGVGGMGVVVAAMHLELQQLVALKFVLPAMAGDKEAVERFLREARAAVRLRSEHVAKVLDVGKLEGGAPYMVMEFLDGADLDAVLTRDGALPPQIAADYVVQACEAIAEAHSVGLVHRDLKPHNLFLTTGVGGAPLVKVLDFGISKIIAANADHALTRTAAVMGSPLYMSPEQMRSARSVDARSDIWSLGVILFQLLSGTVPFEAETITELVLKISQDPPRSLSGLRPSTPGGLLSVVDRCLQKNPAARYANAGELATALAPFASATSAQTAERARLAISARDVQGSTSPPRSVSSSGASSGASVGASSMAMAPTMKSQGTAASWGDASNALPAHASRPRWIYGVASAVVAGVAVVAVMMTRSAPAGAPTSASSSSTSTIATSHATTTIAATLAATTATTAVTATTTSPQPSAPPTTMVSAPVSPSTTVDALPSIAGKPGKPGAKPPPSKPSVSASSEPPSKPPPPPTKPSGSSPDDDIPTIR